jgi:prevent-host-death family protein
LAKPGNLEFMTTVNIGQAKTELSRLIALAEAGEEVEIARHGVPVVRLVPLERTAPGKSFLAAFGSFAGEIKMGEDFELSDDELDAMGA